MGSLLDLEAEKPRAQSANDLGACLVSIESKTAASRQGSNAFFDQLCFHENQTCFKDLATARQALIKDRTAAKARAQTATVPLLKAQFSKRLKQIERDPVQVDAAILSVIAQDERLSESAEILTSIPGIATVTACAMLTEMPEPGTISGKQAASVAGLAPMARQSGTWQGREHIRGGRAEMRRSLSLPAVVATRFNPDMKVKYDPLVASGKCKRLAITAILRKLLVMANSLLRDRRKWAKIHP